MELSSIPAGFFNLDPASNLQQPLHHHQQTLHHGSNNNNINPSPLLSPPPLPPPHPTGPMGGPGYIIRPGSMAEKALLENAPPPKPGLGCPRCGSINTKFCYYNNQSLAQPRHFCRNCRRHWTHNGRLRNIPFGRGSRRNKRSKPSSSSSGLAISSMTAVRSSSVRKALISTPTPGGIDIPEFEEFNNYFYGGINNYNYSGDEMGSMINGPVEQWSMDQLSPVILPQFPSPGGSGALVAAAAGGSSLYGQVSFDEDGQIMHGAGEE